MGPLAKPFDGMSFAAQHRYCNNPDSCNGPGCRRVTGKTRIKTERRGPRVNVRKGKH